MIVKFKKNITKNDQDGFSLIFTIDGKDVELEITRSALAVLKAYTEDVSRLLEIVNFELLFNQVYDLAKDNKALVNKIVIASDWVKLNGKIIFSKDEMQRFRESIVKID